MKDALEEHDNERSEFPDERPRRRRFERHDDDWERDRDQHEWRFDDERRGRRENDWHNEDERRDDPENDWRDADEEERERRGSEREFQRRYELLERRLASLLDEAFKVRQELRRLREHRDDN